LYEFFDLEANNGVKTEPDEEPETVGESLTELEPVQLPEV
jgi:hypothetical protein